MLVALYSALIILGELLSGPITAHRPHRKARDDDRLEIGGQAHPPAAPDAGRQDAFMSIHLCWACIRLATGFFWVGKFCAGMHSAKAAGPTADHFPKAFNCPVGTERPGKL